MRHFTERKEPKKMGTKAMIIRLEYAVTNPCGVAAALPVTFLAVSLTVAVIFANVSFTTVSAILLRLSLMFFCPNVRLSQNAPRSCTCFQWRNYTSAMRKSWNLHLLSFKRFFFSKSKIRLPMPPLFKDSYDYKKHNHIFHSATAQQRG